VSVDEHVYNLLLQEQNENIYSASEKSTPFNWIPTAVGILLKIQLNGWSISTNLLDKAQDIHGVP